LATLIEMVNDALGTALPDSHRQRIEDQHIDSVPQVIFQKRPPGAFTGSARDYLPDHPATGFLYAWKFARNCHGEPHCTEVTEDCRRLDAIPSPEMFMGFWAYLEPSTAVSPAFTEVIYDQAIKFSHTP
jgi:hypothetical protein